MTTDRAPAWPRPNRTQPAEARTRQHYVAFFAGEAADVEVADADLPPGDPLVAFEVETYTDPAWLAGWTALLTDGMAVDPAAVRACTTAMAAWASLPDPLTLGTLQGGMALCSAFAAAGAVAVLDVVTLRWWAAAELLALAADRAFALDEHLVSLTTGSFVHTRGMAKFARPDLGVHVTDPTQVAEMTRTLSLVATAMALGLNPADGDTTRAGGQVHRLVARPDDSGATSPLFFNRWLELLPPLVLA